MVRLDVQTEGNSECTLNETTHEHEIFLSGYAPATVRCVADKSAERSGPDVHQTVNGSELGDI